MEYMQRGLNTVEVCRRSFMMRALTFMILQAYIQKKRQERKRRAQVNQAVEQQASKEREERLNKVFETQRKSIERNAVHQQQKRRELRGGGESSSRMHRHASDSVRANNCTAL